jgi:hypothetical protein
MLKVVRVEELSPDSGILIGTNPPTYTICPLPTNAPSPYVTVCAGYCPGVEETNLPSCWQMTGGLSKTNQDGTVSRICRLVDRRQLGNTTITAAASCSSNSIVIMVQDTNRPSLNCHDVTYCTALGQCVATNNPQGDVAASDSCGYVTVTFAPPPPYNKGTNTVTATATDLAGHTTNCTFNAIVNDCENPQITCPGNIVACASPSGTNIVTWSAPSSGDNCQVTNVSCSPPSGSNFQIGNTTVTCTATDSSGRQGTCTFTVTVLQRELKSVEFITDHGLLKDNNTDWTDSGTTYASPEWVRSPARNNPISQTKNTAVTVVVTVAVTPAGVTFDLVGDGGINYLNFSRSGIVSTGGDQQITATASTALPNYVTTISRSINWTITTHLDFWTAHKLRDLRNTSRQ